MYPAPKAGHSGRAQGGANDLQDRGLSQAETLGPKWASSRPLWTMRGPDAAASADSQRPSRPAKPSDHSRHVGYAEIDWDPLERTAKTASCRLEADPA